MNGLCTLVFINILKNLSCCTIFNLALERTTNYHAILSIVEDIHKNLDKNDFVCGVFIDIEKAFDTVNHKILIKKIDFYGIRGVSNLCFERKQRVKYKSTFSENLSITCGVPHKFHSGPSPFPHIYKRYE